MTTPAKTQSQNLAVAKRETSALRILANTLQVDPSKLLDTLKQTVFRGATETELLTLVVVANVFSLNPLTKELYAFPAKGGGIVPVVSIDGWCRIINNSKSLNGFEFEWEWTDKARGIPFSCTCVMYVKGRDHPVKVTELYSECKRATDPWNNMACRMLRHKALIQAARYAFGFAGIYDEDEARDIVGRVESTGPYLPPPEIPGMDTVPMSEPTSEYIPLEASDPRQDPEPEMEVVPEPEPTPEPAPIPPPKPAPQKPVRTAFQTVVSLCKQDKVSTIELLAWAKETNLTDENTKTLIDMDDKVFSGIIKNWPKILEQIGVMRQGGAE